LLIEGLSDLSPIDGLVGYAGRLGRGRFRPAGSISFPSSWASAFAPIFVASRTGLPAPTIRFWHRFPSALITTASPTSRSRATPAKRVWSAIAIYAITSGLLASFLSTWFPVIPLAGGAILVNLAGYPASESTLITVPIVAVLMGLESALVEAVFVRVLLKGSSRVRFRALLVLNTLNPTVAPALGLAWAFGHIPTFIATLDNCC
jgi:hypothetical protein